MAEQQVYTARWLFPVDRPPLERGTITVAEDRIVSVDPVGVKTADIDFGNAVLIPGLVNAHTHLDLSGLRGLVPPTRDFTQWLRKIIAYRRVQTPEAIDCDIRAGLKEALRFGTTLIGDISGDGRSEPILAETPVYSVVYRELLGLREASLPMNREIVQRWKQQAMPSHRCRRGISPHAPYSVHRLLFQEASGWGLPIAVHLAETREELELLATHSGPFVDFLQEVGVWEPERLAESISSIVSAFNSPTSPPTVWVHGNYLPVNVPIPGGSSIVYCPRTHVSFGHSPHPFRELLARGIRIAVGTDSLASNPDLDVLAEARCIHQLYPDFPGEALLRAITLSGAEALGWQAVTGSLAPGKSADLVVLPVADQESTDPYALLFERANSTMGQRQTLWRGVWRH